MFPSRAAALFLAMPTVRKIWKFISSMRFAIALLALLAAACSLGSLVTQGQSYAWYAQRYSERAAALILALVLVLGMIFVYSALSVRAEGPDQTAFPPAVEARCETVGPHGTLCPVDPGAG